jgi:thiosulfate reductase cytochrome b subunit
MHPSFLPFSSIISVDGHIKSRLRGRHARHAKLLLDYLFKAHKANRQFAAQLNQRTRAVLHAACAPLQVFATNKM